MDNKLGSAGREIASNVKRQAASVKRQAAIENRQSSIANRQSGSGSVSSSALVIGGHLSAIQAALDLAAAGSKVYLVAESPFLGNGPSAIAPHELTAKMLEAVKHPQVEILTLAQVTALEGERGRFRATIQRRPRYVDLARCTACGDCLPVCPVTIPVDGTKRPAIFGQGYGAVPNVFAIDKRGVAPCRAACPADIHAQGYVALIAQGRFQEALELIRQAVPFPGVLGRVCHHPCETQCRRGTEVDAPVAICALKRFVADCEVRDEVRGTRDEERGTEEEDDSSLVTRHSSPPPRVAIIGSGPAGLSAAYFLAKEGIAGEVFEALPVAGGMMAVGIPAYRLPPDVLQGEIAAIAALGVTIHLNHPIDAVEWERLRRDYAAIFVAVGAHTSQPLNIPGEDLAGVISGINFLRDVSRSTFHIPGSNVELGTWNLERVVVIGGGNVAIDSAMTARRMGAREVTILYRRSRAEMPANPWEIAEAEAEDIQFHYLAAPVRVVGQDGRVVALECQRMELGAPDDSGRRRPIPISGSEFTLACETVIVAVGQTVACGFAGLAAADGGTFLTDPVTLQTSLPGVFAGGDAVSGPASVVEAIAAGHRAAESIARYLRGADLAAGRTVARPDTSGITYYTPAEPVRQPRAEMLHLPLSERRGFAETALGFRPETAVAEAQRCLSCGLCAECLACLRVCQPHAILHDQAPASLRLDVGAVLWANGHQAPPLVDGIYVLPDDPQVASAITALVIRELGNQGIRESGNQEIRESARSVRTRTTQHATRLGVFFCHCGDQIGGVLDMAALVEATRSLPGVVYAQELPFSCQPETVAAIREAAASHGLDRLILAACSCCALDQVCYSCTYQRVRCKGNLGGISESANQRIGESQATSSLVTRHSFPVLDLPMEFVNIREQCAWVHEAAPELATDKARRLIAAAVERGRSTEDAGLIIARVDAYHCRACGTCETMCEVSAVKVVEADGRRMAQVDVLRCTGCGTCAAHCPSSAIAAGEPTDRQIANMLLAFLT